MSGTRSPVQRGLESEFSILEAVFVETEATDFSRYSCNADNDLSNMLIHEQMVLTSETKFRTTRNSGPCRGGESVMIRDSFDPQIYTPGRWTSEHAGFGPHGNHSCKFHECPCPGYPRLSCPHECLRNAMKRLVDLFLGAARPERRERCAHLMRRYWTTLCLPNDG
jgi:hypothetical protein